MIRTTTATEITFLCLRKSIFIPGLPTKCFCASQSRREVQARGVVLRECSHLRDARIRERRLRRYHFEIVSDARTKTIASHLELALRQRHAFFSRMHLHRRGSQRRQRETNVFFNLPAHVRELQL